MSTFETQGLVKYPVDAVFTASRDALHLAISHVDDMDHIVKERVQTADGTVELTNVWSASIAVPASIRSIVKPHMVVWTDHSVWTTHDHTVRWTIHAPFFPDHVKCSGMTSYQEASRGTATRVMLRGEIVVDARGLLGLPDVVEVAIARGIEEFVSAVFPSGVRKVIDGVSRHLSELERPLR